MMKTLKIHLSELGFNRIHELLLLQFILILVWWSAPFWIFHLDKHAAWVDSGIWSLVIVGGITFIALIWLCWFLLNTCWQALALPHFSMMVIQFRTLEIWQQFVFYWASFALLLLAGALTLLAIC